MAQKKGKKPLASYYGDPKKVTRGDIITAAKMKANKNGKKKRPTKGNRKPKGTGRRLYTDENPKDTVSIKYATVEDAKATARKVKRINKPYARKIQILTVVEQRAKVAGKPKQAAIAKKAKEELRAKHKKGAKK